MAITTIVKLPAPIQIGSKSYSTYSQTEGDAPPALTPIANLTIATNTTPIAVDRPTGIISGQVVISGATGNTAANGTWQVTGGGSIVSASGATPIVITTRDPHFLVTGLSVTVAMDVTVPPGPTAANGTWVVTVLSPTTFSLNGSAGTGVAGTGSYTLPSLLLIGSSGNGNYTGGGVMSRSLVTSHISSAILLPDS